MKVADRIIEKEGTLDGERVNMGIDMSALAHIMSVLTDLYSDPEAAIIREYSTNALDSHIAAGVTRPIEVTLPTPLSPFLRIRDFGLGLDAEDIRSIYSQYGTSTKRESDDVVGMLGLGCKSALTYTDQFTLIGHKDGVMTQVSIGREDDGGGSMTIVSTGATDETGAEVIIPAKRNHALVQKAAQFFRYWDPGTVVVDGAHPERIGGTWLTDTMLITQDSGSHGVVMGNVFYPAEVEWPMGFRRYGVVWVPIGAVNFTPSREALQMNATTKATLERVGGELIANLADGLKDAVETADDASIALSAYRDAKDILGSSCPPMRWRGHEVAQKLERAFPTNPGSNYPTYDEARMWLVAPWSKAYRSSNGVLAGERLTALWLPMSGSTRYYREATASTGTVVLDNFTGASFTEVRKTKIAQYVSRVHPDVSITHIAAADRLTPTERFWLKEVGCTVLDWSVVEQEVLPKQGRRTVAGTYRALDPVGLKVMAKPEHRHGYYLDKAVAATDLPENGDGVLWLQGNQYDLNNLGRRPEILASGCWIVALAGNRIEKFKRDFPNAKEVHEYEKQRQQQQVDAIPLNVQQAWSLQRTVGRGYLAALPLDKVDDPRFREWRDLAALSVPTAQAETLKRLTHLSPVARGMAAPHEQDYPLYSPSNIEHSLVYINAAYAAFHKEDA